MPSFNINTLDTVAKTLNAGEAGIIGPAGSLQVFNTPVTATASNALLVQGSILGFGIGVNATAANALEVVVGQSGSILSNGRAIQADVTDNTRIVNHGVINGTITALELTADNAASLPINHDIVNTGMISSTRGAAVLLEIANLGFIELSNSGDIVSASDAIDNSLSSSGVGVFRNSGTILAGQDVDTGGNIDFAFRGGSIPEFLINQGFISGQVDMGGGSDFYNANGGITSGRVLGGDGNDTLQGGAGADVLEGGDLSDFLLGRGGDDVLLGDGGSDVMLGGDGNDSLAGGLANDTMNGGGGNDTLLGENGNDILVGQDGDDYLDGGFSNDTLSGGAGDDVLEGGVNDDVLRGGDGSDELAGGTGLDFLTGGPGSDVFVFRTEADAGLGATRDQILDFERGIDLINVVSMIGPAFSFVGTAPFSGPNQIRVIETATGSTIVQFNTDADLLTEAEIRVAGVTGLTADDFAL